MFLINISFFTQGLAHCQKWPGTRNWVTHFFSARTEISENKQTVCYFLSTPNIFSSWLVARFRKLSESTYWKWVSNLKTVQYSWNGRPVEAAMKTQSQAWPLIFYPHDSRFQAGGSATCQNRNGCLYLLLTFLLRYKLLERLWTRSTARWKEDVEIFSKCPVPPDNS